MNSETTRQSMGNAISRRFRTLLSSRMTYAAAFALLFGLYFINFHANQLVWGDAKEYIEISHNNFEEVGTIERMLPGGLLLQWWPPLSYSIYSYMTEQEQVPTTLGHQELFDLAPVRIFAKRVYYFNLIVYVILGILVYHVARLVGVRENYALAVSLFIYLTPRIFFYIQGFYPEILHLVLLLSGIILFIKHERSDKPLFLAASSIVFAYAAFTKGVVFYYVIALTLYLVIKRIRIKKPVWIAVCAFVVPYMALTGIQLYKNTDEHGVSAISTNTWINIECGITATPEDQTRWRYEYLFDQYHASGNSLLEKEQKSKERVMAYIKKTPIKTMVANSFENYLRLVSSSFFHTAIAYNRYKNTEPLLNFLPLTTLPSTIIAYFGIISSIISVLWRNKSIILGLYVCYYSAALLLVGFNTRFFVQAIPGLAIMSAFFIQYLIDHFLRHGKDEVSVFSSVQPEA